MRETARQAEEDAKRAKPLPRGGEAAAAEPSAFGRGEGPQAGTRAPVFVAPVFVVMYDEVPIVSIYERK
ncbi:MAG: hypothetical protein MUF54_03100 [Polyangiaceae bacterium]|nr:hypothetical protein [Polyangiaceae bacterium]